MKTLFFSLVLSLSFIGISQAQKVLSPRTLLKDIVVDLRKQGFSDRIIKNPQLIAGIVRSFEKPCNTALKYQQFTQTIKGVDRPLKGQYWVSLNDRKTMLLVQKTNQGYLPYGSITILERLNTNSYRVREVYCHCENCVVQDRNGNERVLSCGLTAADTPAGYTCKGDKRIGCSLVAQISYFCGNFLYS